MIAKLRGGDRRTIGRANEVVAEVLAAPESLPELVEAMAAPDPALRMRAADVVEKVSAVRPELLGPHKGRLLGEIAAIRQQEVRWHVAQILPRLDLSPAERAGAVDLLLGFLDDTSRIVQVNAMQALAELTSPSDRWRPRVAAEIERLSETGSAAVRARGRRLLPRLRRDPAEGAAASRRTAPVEEDGG